MGLWVSDHCNLCSCFDTYIHNLNFKCLPQGFSPGENNALRQPALDEKSGEAKPEEFPGCRVLTFAGLRLNFRRLLAKAPEIVWPYYPRLKQGVINRI
jgi:hypothetical protein